MKMDFGKGNLWGCKKDLHRYEGCRSFDIYISLFRRVFFFEKLVFLLQVAQAIIAKAITELVFNKCSKFCCHVNSITMALSDIPGLAFK